VGYEDRQDLLGHRSGRITTHYSAADLSRLIEAADSVCERDGRRPELVVMRSALRRESRKNPATTRLDWRAGDKLLISLAGGLGFEPRLTESESAVHARYTVDRERFSGARAD